MGDIWVSSSTCQTQPLRLNFSSSRHRFSAFSSLTDGPPFQGRFLSFFIRAVKQIKNELSLLLKFERELVIGWRHTLETVLETADQMSRLVIILVLLKRESLRSITQKSLFFSVCGHPCVMQTICQLLRMANGLSCVSCKYESFFTASPYLGAQTLLKGIKNSFSPFEHRRQNAFQNKSEYCVYPHHKKKHFGDYFFLFGGFRCFFRHDPNTKASNI